MDGWMDGWVGRGERERQRERERKRERLVTLIISVVHRHIPATTTPAPTNTPCDNSTVAPATAPRGSYMPDGSASNSLYPNIAKEGQCLSNTSWNAFLTQLLLFRP